MPPIAVEGENVLLFVHNLPENVQTLSWYTGVKPLKNCEIASHVTATNSTVVGPAHSGREIVLKNGSLLIKSTTRKDSGYYTLQILDTTSRPELIRAEFFVHSKSIFCELCCRVRFIPLYRRVSSLTWIYLPPELFIHVIVWGLNGRHIFWGKLS